MLLKLYLCAFLFSVTSSQLTGYNSKKITVIGTAWNAKNVAIVETAEGHYFLDGLEAWDDKFYGKKVKVTGKLIMVTHKQASTYPGEFAEWVGTRKVIKKPKWSLYE